MRVPLYLAGWLVALVCSADGQVGAGTRECEEHERCVSLTGCKVLARLVQNRLPSAKDQQRLRSAVCGWVPSSRIPKVCCPLVPLEDCGPRNNPDKIINGNTTLVMEFPWAARLGYRFRGELLYQCGGALISDRYVLTAAHCVEKRQKPVSVRLGEHDVESDVDCSVITGTRVCAGPVVDVDVEGVLSHPEYDGDLRKPTALWNDIALLRLARAVPFSSSIAPICLPLRSSSPVSPPPTASGNPADSPHDVMTVVGWGKIDPDTFGDYSRYLMKLNLRPTSQSRCQDKYKPYGNVRVDEQRQVCAIARDGQDVCNGDSGGPLSSVGLVAAGGSRRRLSVRAILQGVVSFGPRVCATNGVPAVFTRVPYYVTWILANMKT